MCNRYENDSKIGKIKAIRCINFITYDDCVYFPGEYLNVIVGPNGSGKSTLMSAIILCLGGEPELLSRATNIQEFIKNGETMAEISVDIFSNIPNQVISFERSFDKSGKSVYRVNGHLMKRTLYLKEVAKNNIFVNNLCQFLPQDRVQDFAKMNAQELFTNTITSVCSEETIDNFFLLKDLIKQKEAGEKHEKEVKEQQAAAILKKQDLEITLKHDGSRKDLEKKFNVCIAKKKWLEFEDSKKKVIEVSDDLQTISNKLKEKQERLHDNLREQQPFEQKKTKYKDYIQTKEFSERQLRKQRADIENQIDEEIRKIRGGIQVVEQRKREQLRELKNVYKNEKLILLIRKQDIHDATIEFGSESNLKNRISHIAAEITKNQETACTQMKLRQDINNKLEAEYFIEAKILKNRIERLENIKAQKIKVLKDRFPDVYKALEWIRGHQDKLSGKVYDPTMLEINIPDSNNVKFFENIIALRDLLAFTCENESDVSKLIQELCVNKKLAVSIGHVPRNSGVRYSPNIPIDDLRKYGFTSYLVDLIEAPQPLLEYLCSLYGLHQIPIGTNRVNDFTDSIPSSVRLYFGGIKKYSIMISKYSGQPSSMTSQITNKNILSTCDLNELSEKKESLKNLQWKIDSLRNNRAEIEAKISELEYQCAELKNNKRNLERKHNRCITVLHKLHMQEEKLENLRREIHNVKEQIRVELKTYTLNEMNTLNDLITKKIDVMEENQIVLKLKKSKELLLESLISQSEESHNSISISKLELQEAQSIYDKIKSSLDLTKQENKLKLSVAKKLTNKFQPTDPQFPYKNEFRTIPDNIEQLANTITNYKGLLECMIAINPTIEAEYEKICQEVIALEESIEDVSKKNSEINSKLKSIFESWIPIINEVVSDINKNFAHFMHLMGYVGEVALSKQNDYDFESYGILIYVQYRKKVKLQLLDRNVQSGGERAVAIAVYSLSMQHITNVSFRWVDEINQGMDSRNERKIFEMLVEKTGQVGQAQYFFITPKLLSNLQINWLMTLSVIYNI